MAITAATEQVFMVGDLVRRKQIGIVDSLSWLRSGFSLNDVGMITAIQVDPHIGLVLVVLVKDREMPMRPNLLELVKLS